MNLIKVILPVLVCTSFSGLAQPYVDLINVNNQRVQTKFSAKTLIIMVFCESSFIGAVKFIAKLFIFSLPPKLST